MKPRKLIGFVTLASSVLMALSSHATVIGQWTFESNTPADVANSTTITGIAADSGNGTASGTHSSSATDWTTPTGNGSANSLSANTWSVGDNFQFRLSTVGFENISITFDQTGSSSSPRDFNFTYSTDGISFTTFQGYTVLENSSANGGTWSSSTSRSGYSFLFDLGGVSAINDASAVYFRLTDSSTTNIGGTTVGTSGTSRIDNFTVSGSETVTSSVPDSLPLSVAAGALFGIALLGQTRGRRISTCWATKQ